MLCRGYGNNSVSALIKQWSNSPQLNCTNKLHNSFLDQVQRGVRKWLELLSILFYDISRGWGVFSKSAVDPRYRRPLLQRFDISYDGTDSSSPPVKQIFSSPNHLYRKEIKVMRHLCCAPKCFEWRREERKRWLVNEFLCWAFWYGGEFINVIKSVIRDNLPRSSQKWDENFWGRLE